MLIGELVQKTSMSKDTIRFYEKQGLIHIGRKDRRENNYKEYSESTLERLLDIKRLKSLGFTLSEIDEILALMAANMASCENVSIKIQHKIESIEQRISELSMLKNTMLDCLKRCEETCTSNLEGVQSNCSVLL